MYSVQGGCKRVPTFVLPDAYVQVEDPEAGDSRALLTCRALDNRDKMRPDAMIIETTGAGQKVYLLHDTDSGHTVQVFHYNARALM